MLGFAEEIRTRLREPFRLPDEFAALFAWIEARGYVHPSGAVKGDHFGTLQPLTDGAPGTIILFRVEQPHEAEALCKAWFGIDGLGPRLVPFARTGADGSKAAFWLDDAGNQQIVHIGSEGLCSLFAPTPLDFLRLLAIGYEELSGDCMDDVHAEPRVTRQDWPYRKWLTSTYEVTIPKSASAILGDPPDLFAKASDDPFWTWVSQTIR